MHNHNHNHCHHDLRYCEHCDVVYCIKCDKEWGRPNNYIWYWSGIPYRIYWGESDTYTITYSDTGQTVTDASILNAFNNSNKSNYEKGNTFKDVIGCSSVCTHHT